MYPIAKNKTKIEINKRVLAWYKNVMGCGMFYKENNYVLRLISFPSKFLKNEWRFKSLDAGVACDLNVSEISTIASKQDNSRSLIFLIVYA